MKMEGVFISCLHHFLHLFLFSPNKLEQKTLIEKHKIVRARKFIFTHVFGQIRIIKVRMNWGWGRDPVEPAS